MKWNGLTEAQGTRLAECRSIKADIVPIAKCFMIEKGYDAEQAVICTLELLDCNGQYYDPTNEEWRKWIDECQDR